MVLQRGYQAMTFSKGLAAWQRQVHLGKANKNLHVQYSSIKNLLIAEAKKFVIC